MFKMSLHPTPLDLAVGVFTIVLWGALWLACLLADVTA